MVDEKNIDLELDSRRSFTGVDGETEYFIAVPNAEDIRGADWQYSKHYTRCLNEGLPTTAELTDILKRRGVIGQDFDKRAEELGVILNNWVIKLTEVDTNEEKTEIAHEIAKAREALFQWNQRLSGPMSNSCEQMADDARLEFLTSCIIQSKDGSRIWPSYNDFLATKDQSLTLKARYEVMLFLQGYDSDFLDHTPEAVAIKEVQLSLIKEAEVDQQKIDELKKLTEEVEDVEDVAKNQSKKITSTKKVSGSIKKEKA